MIDTPLPDNRFAYDYFFKDAPICGIYYLPWAVEYIKQKFLPLMVQQKYNHASKVFISRADASVRKIINEDQLFELFAQQGFVRYSLGNISVLEQIALFHHADIIVAAHGAALVNIMFCKPTTKIVEIFQARSDCAIFYLAQTLQLDYQLIQTVDFENITGHENTYVPLFLMQNYINKNLVKRKE